MPVVTAASVVSASTSTISAVDPAAVDLPATLDVDITAWLVAAAASSPATA
ncbi:hypothetical protein [Frigoribacterium endophyticum]|uniref:hypothetical protein n=1 Tax=Frigoribacterium endophyticum TaxID=1522176 RepID=UPI00142162BA|nr:hypothetical protein [Frigoribacterium endophyticum]NII50336.1 hypothetical protein [Frigoribacterium endophyticum]